MYLILSKGSEWRSVHAWLHIFLSLTTHLSFLLFFPSGPFRDCLAAQDAGHATSGMYLIKPDETERPVQVWCEQGIDGGGWTVIQTRRDGSVNFFRNWENYKVMTVTFDPFCLPACLSFCLWHSSNSSSGAI